MPTPKLPRCDETCSSSRAMKRSSTILRCCARTSRDAFVHFVARSISGTSIAVQMALRSGSSRRSPIPSTTCSVSGSSSPRAPRHADLLLVTGVGAAGMLGPLLRTFDAMPAPKLIVAVGSEAASGGLLTETYATRGGVADEISVDVFVPGSPPSPFAILHGILLAIGLLPVNRGNVTRKST